jgi:hypothetical protein
MASGEMAAMAKRNNVMANGNENICEKKKKIMSS